MGVLSGLEPQEVFYWFEELSKIPRRTFKNEKISNFCVEFAKSQGLWYDQDALGNVIIKKPGTVGYENSEPVILQGHMDMVATKTVESDHDFDKDPLELFVENDYIGAKDTTLGGDDGFALAIAMGILASKDIPHPPIEAVFTIDEEIGMSGASGIDFDKINGTMLLNMDGEEEGVLTVGCAGANICDIVIPITKEEANGTKVIIKIRGMQGGHSGNEIQNQRGNAHKTMGRILYKLSKHYDFSLIGLNGGSGANVIAQYCTAEVLLPAEQAETFAKEVEALGKIIYAEFAGQEPDLKIFTLMGAKETCLALDPDSKTRVLWYVYASLDGVQCFDRCIEGAVESSLNAGVVKTTDDTVRVSYQVRGSIDSKLEEMMDRLHVWCDITGATIEMQGSYPAWSYKADSKLRPLMTEIYKEMFGKEPEIVNVHGGLEGGIFCGHKPELDIVCFGPDLIHVHTAEERMGISSTKRTWEFVKEILKACK